MASVKNSRSSEERRRKKQPNKAKLEENGNKIVEAHHWFLESQNVTPEIYEDQQIAFKEIQVAFTIKTKFENNFLADKLIVFYSDISNRERFVHSIPMPASNSIQTNVQMIFFVVFKDISFNCSQLKEIMGI